jgi:hypothetical protein
MRLVTLRLLLAFVCFLLVPESARAQCLSSGDCIMPPGGCAYVGVAHLSYGVNDAVNSLVLDNSGACTIFPPLGGSGNASFPAVANVGLSSDGGNTFTIFSAPAALTVHLATVGQNGSVKTIQTEMLQMDISGGSLPSGVMLRESPTLASPGSCTSTDQGGGLFQITSFFDVFTELSLDHGVTWMPSSGSINISILPGAPLPAERQTWGGVKAIYR